MHPAYGAARVLIRRGSDGAGIEDHQIGRGALASRFKASPGKQRFERRAVGLGSAAPEILNEESAQTSV